MQACGPCARLHESVSITRRLERHAVALSSGQLVRGKRGPEIGVVNMTSAEKVVVLRAVLAERRRLLRQVCSLKLAAMNSRPGFSEKMLDRGNPEVGTLGCCAFLHALISTYSRHVVITVYN
jgi:hypothetical protein